MPTIGLGIQLWAQNTDWPSYLAAARRVDELGYDHLWTWDHLVSAVGDPDSPVFEGYASLAAWAALTTHVRLGLLVGANTFRNPAVVATVSGEVEVTTQLAAEQTEMMRAKRIRPLAVVGDKALAQVGAQKPGAAGDENAFDA